MLDLVRDSSFHEAAHAITALRIGARVRSVRVSEDRCVCRIGARHAFDHATVALAGPAIDTLMGFPKAWSETDEANARRYAVDAAEVEAARRRAQRIVSENLPLIVRLGKLLCAWGELSGHEVLMIVGRAAAPVSNGTLSSVTAEWTLTNGLTLTKSV